MDIDVLTKQVSALIAFAHRVEPMLIEWEEANPEQANFMPGDARMSTFDRLDRMVEQDRIRRAEREEQAEREGLTMRRGDDHSDNNANGEADRSEREEQQEGQTMRRGDGDAPQRSVPRQA